MTEQATDPDATHDASTPNVAQQEADAASAGEGAEDLDEAEVEDADRDDIDDDVMDGDVMDDDGAEDDA